VDRSTTLPRMPRQRLKVKKKNMSPYVMGNEKLEMIPISHYLMGNGAITQTAKKKAADFSLILMNALNFSMARISQWQKKSCGFLINFNECIEFLINFNEKSVSFFCRLRSPVTRDH